MVFLRDFILDYIDKIIVYSSDSANLSYIAQKRNKHLDENQRKFRMVIDAESCLDRLTGGFFPDWQSGGEWKRLNEFYRELRQSCESRDIELVIFFDGTLPKSDSSSEWYNKQINNRKRINRIFKSDGTIRFSNWIHPIFSIQTIKDEINDYEFYSFDYESKQKEKFLYSFNTYEDHKKEIIEYCIKHKCDCLLTNDFELISLFIVENGLGKYSNLLDLDIYSASSFKLSKTTGEITAQRINIDAILGHFKMDKEQFGWFSICLGTRWFPDSWLYPFYKKLCRFDINYVHNWHCVCDAIKNIGEFIVSLGRPIDVDDIAKRIFLDCTPEEYSTKMIQFQQNVDYFFKDTMDENYNPWIHDRNELLKRKREFYELINEQIELDLNRSLDKSPNSSFKTKNTSLINLAPYLKMTHINCLSSPQITWLYHKNEIYLPVTLEPESGPEIDRADDIYRNIRSHFYSVLFGDTVKEENSSEASNEKKTVAVKEVILDTKSNLIDPFIVEVIPDKQNLIDLWSQSIYKRREKFFELIDPEHALKDFCIPEYLIMPCLVVREILKGNKYLSDYDIKAFIGTFENCKKNRFSGPKFDKTDLRASHLASIFLRGIEAVSLLNEICGLPFEADCFKLKLYFDGKIFQRFYAKIHSHEKEILEKMEDSKCFSNLYNFITKDLALRISPNVTVNPYILDQLKAENNKPSRVRDEILYVDNSKKQTLGRGSLIREKESKNFYHPKPSLTDNKILSNKLLDEKLNELQLDPKFEEYNYQRNQVKQKKYYYKKDYSKYRGRSVDDTCSNKQLSPQNTDDQKEKEDKKKLNKKVDHLVRYPVEQMRLQNEVMKLFDYVPPVEEPKRVLRYTFHESLTKKYQETRLSKNVDINGIEALSRETEDTEVYPEFCRYSELPAALIDYNVLLKEKQKYLERKNGIKADNNDKL